MTESIDGDAYLARVIECGRLDSETAAWLADALLRWARDGADAAAFARYAGISTTPSKRSQAARNRLLVAVAGILGGDTLAEQAHRLDAACRRFERAGWRRLGEPPPGEIERLLLNADKAAPLPGYRQLRNICAETFWPGSFRAAVQK
jgi:hypothetical protein